MAKGTIIFLFLLTLITVLISGIKVGMKLERNKLAANITPILSPTLTPITPSPTSTLPLEISEATTSSDITSESNISTITGTSSYTNKTCGFSFSYPGSYINQKSVNEQSIILTDPNDPKSGIATTCAQKLPRPPIAKEKIEAIILDGEAATLYHDQDIEGNPRDEVIVKHPDMNLEIIIAGYGATFQSALSSFRFIQ